MVTPAVAAAVCRNCLRFMEFIPHLFGTWAGLAGEPPSAGSKAIFMPVLSSQV
jgi:hypothetical protein